WERRHVPVVREVAAEIAGHTASLEHRDAATVGLEPRHVPVLRTVDDEHFALIRTVGAFRINRALVETVLDPFEGVGASDFATRAERRFRDVPLERPLPEQVIRIEYPARIRTGRRAVERLQIFVDLELSVAQALIGLPGADA